MSPWEGLTYQRRDGDEMPLISDQQRRDAVLALEPQLGPEATRTFDELLPTIPRREVITAEFWYRDDVLRSVDVRAMRQLHDAFVGTLGAQHAATLMEFLPPVPWDVLLRHGLRRTNFQR
jgi:hypothetical protein